MPEPSCRLFQTILLGLLLSSTLQMAAPASAQQTNQEANQEAAHWITVEPGDTLFSLSRAHGVSVAQLREWNELGADSGIRAGMRLRIKAPTPVPADSTTADGDGDAQESERGQAEVDKMDDQPAGGSDSGPVAMRVLPGGLVAIVAGEDDTMASIARRFDVEMDSLAAMNVGLPLPLEAGMVVIMPDDRVVSTHTVKRGETLYALARQYGVSVDRLRALNDVPDAALRVGQTLIVPATDAALEGPLPLPEAGQFPIRVYPAGMSGRTLSKDRTYDPQAYQIGHPSLQPGTLVLVQAEDGRHVFAEVLETVPMRTPRFVEGSEAVMNELGTAAGESVTFRVVR